MGKTESNNSKKIWFVIFVGLVRCVIIALVLFFPFKLFVSKFVDDWVLADIVISVLITLYVEHDEVKEIMEQRAIQKRQEQQQQNLFDDSKKKNDDFFK